MSALAATPTPTSRAQANTDLLQKWRRREKAARSDRMPYERQWMINQHFAASVQHLRWSDRDHRVLADTKDRRGNKLVTVDVLRQYANTVIGKLAADDFRPELLCSWRDDNVAEDGTQFLNDALEYAWSEEIKAERKIRAVIRCLVELGTGGIRVRYDRHSGQLVDGQYPHLNGRPVPNEHVHAVMAQAQDQGVPGLEMKPLREGYICWEKLAAWNLLPPPGVDDPAEFPWEIIVRPVPLTDLKAMYGQVAADLREDTLDEMGLLVYQNMYTPALATGESVTPATVQNLKGHALVFTGYQRPSSDAPAGQMVVWAQNTLLDAQDQLPLSDAPYGPRSGITYFRWDILEGRFWGRSFYESGIGAQQIRNKRRSQQDQIISRSMPKVYVEEGFKTDRLTGEPLEIIKLPAGGSKPLIDPGVGPGPWMTQDIEQIDNDIEQALGVKQASLGNAPAGVSAYSAMALLTENDATKLDPVAGDIRLGVADCVRDTIEEMKQWPPQKKLYIVGEEGELKVLSWDASNSIPAAYKAKPATGSALPRSQAAEVQKIADLWNAAAIAGVVAQNPSAWIQWYKSSLDAGQVLDLPDAGQQSEQLHKAALENIVMVRTGTVLPVAPYDDATIHIQEHDAEEMRLSEAQAMGDPDAGAQIQVIEQHKQLHLLQAQQSAAGAGVGVPQAQGAPPNPATSTLAPFPPNPRFANELQTPRLPYDSSHGGFR